MDESPVHLNCVVLGTPQPKIAWFRNEEPITESPRHRWSYENNKATLAITPAVATDAGIYKCVAENEKGQAYCVARLRLGDLPDRPSRPEVELVSDTEVFLTWQAPPPTAGSLEIVGYKLEYRRAGEGEWGSPWNIISSAVDEESAVVRYMDPCGKKLNKISLM